MTATAVGLAILACLVMLNLRLGGSALYPPAHFSLLWSALLAASLFSTGRFFQLSVDAVTVFAVGAVALSVGGALRLALEQRRLSTPQVPEQPVSPALTYLLAAALLALILLFPTFWRYLLSVADPRFDNLWWGIRSGTLALAEMQGQKPWQQVFYDNVTVAAILLALTAVTHYGERGTSRVVSVGLVLVATVYSLATGSRAGGAVVLMGALGIRMVKRGRLTWRHLSAGVVGVLLMYVPLTLLRTAKGGDVFSIAANDGRMLGDMALLYTVGPLAAFDAYLHSPSTLTETWSISYFFLHAANRLGFNIAAPSTHLGYVHVGPQGTTNVYTMYLAYYPEFGIAGVIVLCGMVGYGLVWLYRSASVRGGSRLLLYGLAFNEVCKSGFNEGFFMGLNMWLKAAAYCLALYFLEKLYPARKSEFPLAKPHKLLS